jgi:p-hydroxybenzoate 3-monooxygenase
MPIAHRTQVGIVGAGPAGLLLARLLHLEGIESIIVENRSRSYVENRVRAGVLEQGTADMLRELGAGERMHREGLVHRGFELRFNGEPHRVDMYELTEGRSITVYGQNEVVRDLIDLRETSGGEIWFESQEVRIDGFLGDSPEIAFRSNGQNHQVHCDFIAGCDGFHGICRPAIPAGVLTFFDKTYPFAWLGILAEAPPSSHELIYARHDRGFALHSMRSPAVTRLYLQCEPDENLEAWPDSRIWDELDARLETNTGFSLARGPIIRRDVTPMRAFVTEPMQHRRLFLAGDSAHIVPPTGAKGLNLAAADVRALGHALARFYHSGNQQDLETWSRTRLRRVWRAQHFSWWMTSMLHRFPAEDAYDRRRQLAELDNIVSSRAAARNLAEDYSGLPFTS